MIRLRLEKLTKLKREAVTALPEVIPVATDTGTSGPYTMFPVASLDRI